MFYAQTTSFTLSIGKVRPDEAGSLRMKRHLQQLGEARDGEAIIVCGTIHPTYPSSASSCVSPHLV
jgi:hypothetical protein